MYSYRPNIPYAKTRYYRVSRVYTLLYRLPYAKMARITSTGRRTSDSYDQLMTFDASRADVWMFPTAFQRVDL